MSLLSRRHAGSLVRPLLVPSLLALAAGAGCSAAGGGTGNEPGGAGGSGAAGSGATGAGGTGGGTGGSGATGGTGGTLGIDAGSGGSGATCTDVIDLVLVLDVSSSMNFVLAALRQDMAGVVSAANAVAPDAHFGLVTFADNELLDPTGPQGNGLVHVAAGTLQAAFSYVETTYTNQNRNPGDGPTGPTTQNPICEENALDALHTAATVFPWRANATRVIILATDDTFLERPDNYGDKDGDGDWNDTSYPREGNYPARTTLAETTAALVDGNIRVFSFTRLTPPGPLSLTRCGTGRRLPWTSVSDGWSTGYQGQAPLPLATQGRNYDLEQVRSGALSLAVTIQDVVVESYCNPPVH